MICILSLITFSILGIFSAKYRHFAKIAFSCVARRLTLRSCEMAFDRKVRMKIVAKLSARSIRLARFTNKYFQVISWAFTVLLFISLIFTANGLYNIVVYGTCDPVSGSCYLTPFTEAECGSPECVAGECNCGPNNINCQSESLDKPCEECGG
ncbi:MAG: hypothetical protein ISS93_03300 [Candidatus Aenigmarchaeota archaeon]|nr:hypothetical protein [Candidatus Aenigmarchaeota archaeon]